MKNMPKQTLLEIAIPIAERIGVSVDKIRQGGKNFKQEEVWARAQVCAAGRAGGWGDSAIGRFLNIGHDIVSRHCKAQQ